MIYTSQEEIDAALAYWQKVLRLQDWDVRAKIVRLCGLSDSGCQGDCSTTPSTKKALIRLLDSVDYTPSTEWAQDHERVLVHELMHIHMNEVMDEVRDVSLKLHNRLYTQEERVVEMAATAMISLKRQIPVPQSPNQIPPLTERRA